MITGLSNGLIYVLLSLGLVIVFSIMEVINFAHGEVFAIGAYIALVCTVNLKLPFFLSVIVSILLAGCLGIVLEKVLFKRVRKIPLNFILTTIGLSVVIQNILLLTMGGLPYSFPPIYENVIKIGIFSIFEIHLLVIVISAMCVIGLFCFLKYVKFGKAIRSTAQDEEGAILSGVNVKKVYYASWFISFGFAALAGALIGQLFVVSGPYMGTLPLQKAFAVIILGGLGSIPGTVVGGLVLGLSEALAVNFIPTGYSDILGFVIIIVVLILKPTGLFGGKKYAQ
jgi:branched-chain amino acid transport system permease protein